jgi:hypothetical protein
MSPWKESKEKDPHHDSDREAGTAVYMLESGMCEKFLFPTVNG